MKPKNIVKIIITSILLTVLVVTGSTALASETDGIEVRTFDCVAAGDKCSYTLNGWFNNPNGYDVEYGFEIWIDAPGEYPVIVAGTGTDGTMFSATSKTFLIDDEDYCYRAYCRRGTGFVYGETRNFSTPSLRESDSLIEVNTASIPYVEGASIENAPNVLLVNSLITTNSSALDVVTNADVVSEFDDLYDTEYLYQHFIDNYYNDAALRYSLNIFDALVYNRKENIQDIALHVPDKLLHLVFSDSWDSALSNVFGDLGNKRYNTALNSLLGADYTSTLKNTLSYEKGTYSAFACSKKFTNSFKSAITDYKKIGGYIDKTNTELIAGVGIAEKCREYQTIMDTEGSILWQNPAMPEAEYFSHYISYMKAKNENNKLLGYKSSNQEFNDGLQKEFFSDSFKCYAGVATDLFNVYDLTMGDFARIQVLENNNEEIVELFKRMQNCIGSDDDFNSVISSYIADAENQKSRFVAKSVENIISVSNRYIFSAATTKVQKSVVSAANDSCTKTIAGAFSVYNKVAIAADLTGELTQAVASTKDLLNYAIEMKYLYRVENYARKTLNHDIELYSVAQTDANAENIMNDLYFLKMVRLRLNELAKKYFETQTTSILGSAFGFSESSAGITAMYNQQRDNLVDSSLVEGDFTSEPYSVSSGTVVVTKDNPRMFRRITGGVSISGGLFSINSTSLNIYIPYINLSGGTLQILGDGNVEIGELNMTGGNIILAGGNIKIDSDINLLNATITDCVFQVNGSVLQCNYINSCNYYVTVEKSAKMIVTGNYQISKYYEYNTKYTTYLCVNGALSIDGDFIGTCTSYAGISYGGVLTLNGTMEVDGNISGFFICNMTNSNSNLIVLGNFTPDFDVSKRSSFNNGNIYIFGNIKTFGYQKIPSTNLYVHLCGNKKQIVGFCKFSNLILDNSSSDGIEFNGSSSYVYTSIDNTSNTNVIAGTGLQFCDSVKVVGGIYNYPVTLYNYTCINDLTINGDVYLLNATVTDCTLHIGGSVFQCNEEIFKNYYLTIGKNSKMIIDGNYTMSKRHDYLADYTTSTQVDGTLEVGGNFVGEWLSYAGETRCAKLTVNGSMVIGGNFTGGCTCVMNSDNSSITVKGNYAPRVYWGNYLYRGVLHICSNVSNLFFDSYENLIVILDGDKMQTVSSSYFANLILDNKSADGVVFTSSVTVSRLFDHRQNKFTLYNNGSGSSFPDFDGDGLKDNVDPYPLVGNPCSITVSADSEKGTATGSIETTGGTEVTVTATPSFKYEFVNWTDSTGKVASTAANYTFIAKVDTVLTANFVKRSRYISGSFENGSISFPQKAEIESTVNVTVLPNEGYQLTAGSLKANNVLIENCCFEMPDCDVVITAGFTKNDSYFLLKSKLAEASAYDSDFYTTESFAVLSETVAVAQPLLKNDITTEKANEQIGLINSAIAGLIERSSISISATAGNTIPLASDISVANLSVYINYNNGTNVLTSDYYVENFDSNSVGNQTVTIRSSDYSTEAVVTVLDTPDFICELTNDHAEIIRQVNQKAEYVVPEAVNNLPVIVIKSTAFSNCSGISSVTVPLCITTIENGAFTGCADMVIKCYNASAMHQYATAKSLCFELISVPVTNLLISSNEITLLKGNSTSLSFSFEPFYSNETFTWSSSNSNVATVSDAGIVNGAHAGTAVITITASGGMTASCTVKVLSFEGAAYCDFEYTLIDDGKAAAICGYYGRDKSILVPEKAGNCPVTTLKAEIVNNSNVKSVTVSRMVAQIELGAFDGSNSISEIIVSEENSNYCSVDGVLFNKDKTTIIAYPKAKEGAFSVPDSVTEIGDSAFSGCSQLTGVNFNSQLKTIGDNAFINCTGLTELTIPEGVTFIGKTAFQSCTSLLVLNYNAVNCQYTNQKKTLFYVGGYKEIAGVFRACCNLKTVNIGGKVESIAPNIFRLSYFVTINIPDDNSLTSIGEYSFGYCDMVDVKIPNNVTIVGSYAFSECFSLKSIDFGNVTAISARVLYGSSKLERIKMSESVTTIGNSAFVSCTALTSLTIPESVTTIGTKIIPSTSTIKCYENSAAHTYAVNNDIPFELLNRILVNSDLRSVSIGSSMSLATNITPMSLAEKGVVWSSSNEAVATVSADGSVAGVAAGVATITATATDGECSGSFMVRVAGIAPKADTSTFVDNESGVIYGLEPGIDSADSFIGLSDLGCTIEYEETSAGFGTGTVVNIMRGGAKVDSYTILIFGDVNGDGMYDGTDSFLVGCLVNGLLTREQVGEVVYSAADCNHDGAVDIVDAAMLEQAGILLASVNQTKPDLTTDAVFIEYMGMIDQLPDVEGDITPAVESAPDTEQAPEEPSVRSFWCIITKILAEIFSAIKSLLSL